MCFCVYAGNITIRKLSLVRLVGTAAVALVWIVGSCGKCLSLVWSHLIGVNKKTWIPIRPLLHVLFGTGKSGGLAKRLREKYKFHICVHTTLIPGRSTFNISIHIITLRYSINSVFQSLINSYYTYQLDAEKPWRRKSVRILWSEYPPLNVPELRQRFSSSLPRRWRRPSSWGRSSRRSWGASRTLSPGSPCGLIEALFFAHFGYA